MALDGSIDEDDFVVAPRWIWFRVDCVDDDVSVLKWNRIGGVSADHNGTKSVVEIVAGIGLKVNGWTAAAGGGWGGGMVILDVSIFISKDDGQIQDVGGR